MGSSFGRIFQVATFGESHGGGVGAVVQGCPAGMALSEADIQPQLDRRRPGQSDITTPRNEADQVEILSGIEHGKTLGTPIGILIRNQDTRPKDYREMVDAPRPSHADYTYRQKYGVAARSGGGRASARETVARVAAGAIAEKVLEQLFGLQCVAWVESVGDITCKAIDTAAVSRSDVDKTVVRCPDSETAAQMEAKIRAVRKQADSIGGVIRCVIRNVPVGLGEPVFDKLEALLAHAMLSLPATKGFEFGSGFAGTAMLGSEHNDLFAPGVGERLRQTSNHSGGIQGGISSGEPIDFRVAFKPVATIGKAQKTVDYQGNPIELRGKGRHDPCVVPRAVPMVESLAALVLLDAHLRRVFPLYS